MNASDRDDLAEVIFRWGRLLVLSNDAFHARPWDLGRYDRATDASDEARREMLNLLYGLRIDEPEQAPHKVIDIRSNPDGLTDQRG